MILYSGKFSNGANSDIIQRSTVCAKIENLFSANLHLYAYGILYTVACMRVLAACNFENSKQYFRKFPLYGIMLHTCVYVLQIARYSTVIVNGIFWAPGMDRLLTTDQCRQLHPPTIDIKAMRNQGIPQLPQRLLAIADISCDLRVRQIRPHYCNNAKVNKIKEGLGTNATFNFLLVNFIVGITHTNLVHTFHIAYGFWVIA